MLGSGLVLGFGCVLGLELRLGLGMVTGLESGSAWASAMIGQGSASAKISGKVSGSLPRPQRHCNQNQKNQGVQKRCWNERNRVS